MANWVNVGPYARLKDEIVRIGVRLSQVDSWEPSYQKAAVLKMGESLATSLFEQGLNIYGKSQYESREFAGLSYKEQLARLNNWPDREPYISLIKR